MTKTTPANQFVLALSLVFLSGCFELPQPQIVGKDVTHLDQNWTADQRSKFYHASQGTVMMPVDWFLALEQPEIKFFGSVGLFHRDEYLTRFGFLRDETSEWNSYGLPVGFAVCDVVDPMEGRKEKVVGLTCAACHTGELHFAGRAIRIDGATALIDVTKMQSAIAAAFYLTAKNPLRFDRFARRVLGDRYDDDTKEVLKQRIDTELARGLAEKLEISKREKFDRNDGGYGRTDALAKIGNFVFGTALDDDNLRIGNAPVRFPPIWDTHWFDWAQYNGSIEQPMVRNIGEALGVRARVNLVFGSERFLESTVDIKGLHEIESLLAGNAPLQGLHSPKWPQHFGYINQSKADAGAKLYRQICQRCHLPPLQSDEIWNDEYWISNDQNSMTYGYEPPVKLARYLDLEGVNIGNVGTDPGQATNFFSRYVNTGKTILPSLTKGPWTEDGWSKKERYETQENNAPVEYPETMLPVGVALQKLTVAIAEKYYDEQGFNKEERELYSGNRNPGARSLLEYRPRPLNGIWASPPFLHNGSVRTIFQLLSPPTERDAVFYVGTRQYDPIHLGYENKKFHGAFRYDTRIPGNLNTGHAFESKPVGNGVIGPRLSPEERFQLIEYLKTLGPAGKPLLQ